MYKSNKGHEYAMNGRGPTTLGDENDHHGYEPLTGMILQVVRVILLHSNKLVGK